MITDTGIIREGERTVGQIQIVETEGGEKRVQLYNSVGVFLCDCPYTGDADEGYVIGMAMQRAYQKAWKNAKTHYSMAAQAAMNEPSEMEIA